MRARALILALALVLALPVAHGEAATPQLAGVTVISGDRSGWVDVELPVTLRPERGEPPFTVTARGAGAMQGMALREDDGNQWDAFTGNGPGLDPSSSDHLSAGRLRLYLITVPGQPLELTLRLPQLTGEARLTVEHPVEVRGGPFVVRRKEDGRAVGGQDLRMGTSGIFWGRSGWRFPDGAQGDADQCVYLPGATHGGADQFDDGCPGAGHGTAAGPSSGSTSSTFVAHGAEAGSRWGIGANARSWTGGPAEVVGEAYVVDFAPATERDPFPYPAGSPYRTPEEDRPAAAQPAASSSAGTTARPAVVAPVAIARAARWVLLTVRCPSGATTCRGRASAGTTATSFTVPAGESRSVRVLLTLADRRRLAAGRAARPIVRLTQRGTRPSSRRVTVRA